MLWSAPSVWAQLSFPVLFFAIKIPSDSFGFLNLPWLTFSGEYSPKLASRIQHVAPSA